MQGSALLAASGSTCSSRSRKHSLPANPRCNARKRVSSPSRPALELLAASPQGCTEALLSAHGVTVKILADVVRAGQLSPTIKELVAKPDLTNTQEYHDIRAFLNICDLIAVGINEGAFSDRVSSAYWGDVLPDSYRDAEPLIKQIRSTPGEGTAHTYADLEKLCKKWSSKEALTGITRIECPPMAL